MSESFRALLATNQGGDGHKVIFTEMSDSDLMAGDVTVKVEHSTVNYKDGLTVTNAAPMIKTYPLVPGIDFAGTVIESSSARFKEGDRVVLNGYGVGEGHHGGYAGKARVKSEWLVPLPDSISTSQAAAIGTAGYTAMLCVLALEHAGVTPDKGSILITGSAGGVGSVAIAILKKLAYHVVASSRRFNEEADYLRGLGADEIVDAAEFSKAGEMLNAERWAGAVDTVSSQTLATVLTQIKYNGAVAACGVASGVDLPTNILPFILRGVTLAGIDSVHALYAQRERAWQRLAEDLDLSKLEQMTSRATLDDVPQLCTDILAGKVRGRVVVDL